MKFLSVLVFAGLGAVGIGGWYGFSVLRPKNLKQYLEWQGFELASKDGGNIWKSILDEHRETIKSRTKKTDPKEQDVQNWCFTHLSSPDYELFKDDASKICVNNPQTVRAKIIQQDGSVDALIKDSDGSKDQEYRVAYIFRKHIDGVLDLIGFKPPEKEEGQEVREDVEGGGKALETWCKKSLEEKPDDSLVSNVKLLCSPKGFKTIKDLISKQNEQALLLTDDGNVDALAAKYKEIEKKASWTADQPKDGEDGLKEWCNKNEKKNFYDEGTFSNVYPKFRFRCLKAISS